MRFPEIVRAYIEIVPTDGVKYEFDKHSLYLMVDRPQRFSSFCPTMYGFVPAPVDPVYDALEARGILATVTRSDSVIYCATR